MAKRLQRQNLSWLDKSIENNESLLVTDDFVVVPNINFDNRDLDKLHFVAFVTHKHKDIISVRDIRGTHLPLLNAIFDKTLTAISENFEISSCDLRVFVHYVPSIFRFHVHFCCVEMVKSSILVGRAIQVSYFVFLR
jgi:m7GpppX diphosphatase